MKKMNLAGLVPTVLAVVLLQAGTAFGAVNPSYSQVPKTAEEAAEALAAQSDILYVSGKELHSEGVPNDTFWDELDIAINAVFRSCDASEMDSLRATYDVAAPEILSYEVREDQLQILVDNQALVNSWLESSVPTLIPDGSSAEDAVWTAYLHVVNSYLPDYIALEDTGYVRKEAQGAAYVLKNGKGICAGLTKLFRSIVESIPFDANTGLVDYSAQDPVYLKAAVLENRDVSHEWAAISFSGVWYHYDLSIINTANLSERYKMTESQMSAADYGDMSRTIWSY